MNQPETEAMLAILGSIWPLHPITEQTVTAWTWAFEDVPVSVVEDAIKQWMRSGKPFFPMPSDLRKLAAVDRVAPELVPEAAWAEVIAEVRRVGNGGRHLFQNGERRPIGGPSFSHPLIKQAAEATGWNYICTCDKEGVVKAQFTATLEALLAKEVNRAQNGPMSTPTHYPAVEEGQAPYNVRSIRGRAS